MRRRTFNRADIEFAIALVMIALGAIEPDDPDEKLERLMDTCGYFDVSWRHEALSSLRIRRHEIETGDPF